MSLAVETGARPAAGPEVAGPLLFAASVVAAVIVFWFGLVSLTKAWAVPEYSHGPIIPLISLFLFLREMRGVPPSAAPVTDRWPGLAVIALGLGVGVAGSLMRIDQIVTYGFIVWIAGMVLVCFGWRRGLLFWPAVVHLTFMLPLPQIVYWRVSTYLQGVSSEIGVWLIKLAGIPVYLDGNIIDLGVYMLQVAEACSGLRYLFPMLSFSFVFAILYRGPFWHKALLLLAAAPITVLMNSFRIGMIGVLVDSYGIGHAEGFLHAFEGWIIFVACVLILFGLATSLQRISRDRRPLSETLDIEFVGLGAQLARARRLVPAGALVAAATLTAVTAAAMALAPNRTFDPIDREPLVVFPKLVGAWSAGPSEVLDPRVERTLGADDYFGASFASPDETAPVNLFIAYYLDQTDGSGIHSPEACIPAGGWEVSHWRRVRLRLLDGSEVEANRAVIQRGVSRQLVYFWFDLRGQRIASSYRAKVLNMRDMLAMGRSDGALVRVITPMPPAEPDSEADARLQRFVAEIAPILPRYIPD